MKKSFELKSTFGVRLSAEAMEQITDLFIDEDTTSATQVFYNILDAAVRKTTASNPKDTNTINDLKSEIESMGLLIDRLKGENSEMLTDASALNSVCSGLKAENARLLEENAQLQNKVAEQSEYCESVENRFTESLQQYNNEKIELEAKATGLEQKIAALNQASEKEIQSIHESYAPKEYTVSIELNPVQLELVEAYRRAMVKNGGCMVKLMQPGFIEPITENSPVSKGNYLLNVFLLMIQGYSFKSLLKEYPSKVIKKAFTNYLLEASR